MAAGPHLVRHVALAFIVLAACHARPDPIAVDGRVVRVTNQSREEWHDVAVWVNDQYRVTIQTLAPNGTLAAPLDTFVEGFGHRFSRQQTVRKIEVRAKDAKGATVSLRWGG